MEMPSMGEKKLSDPENPGTLAIDIGNSTTVVAFQGALDQKPTLLDIRPLSRIKGEVPSKVWFSKDEAPFLLVGQQVVENDISSQEDPNLSTDFKRWIGSPSNPEVYRSSLLPEKAGELLIQQIWKRLPNSIKVKRLVLTAPVETYRSYRAWLNKVCNELPIEEVALVDEPTAAAMGAGLPAGSKLLVIDIGGSTVDLSLVALEGGEGRAEPVAQLLRFGGRDLEGQSKQVLRCAKVLGKAGMRLGGRDIDRWVANHLVPETPATEKVLNAAERLKCRLSQDVLKETEVIEEIEYQNLASKALKMRMCRSDLEDLLADRGLIKSFDSLLEKTLADGRAKGCSLEDLQGVVVVGGGARIPLIRRWLKEKVHPAPLLTPPPIEAVAIGALSLTPGVKIKDVLQRGVSLRCWDQRSERHTWHQLFVAGQPWPTAQPLEINLASSKANQIEIELVIGEPEINTTNEIIFIDGIPTVKDAPSEPQINYWDDPPILIALNPPGQPGDDCLRLSFSIDSQCKLNIEGIDIRNGASIGPQVLGSVR